MVDDPRALSLPADSGDAGADALRTDPRNFSGGGAAANQLTAEQELIIAHFEKESARRSRWRDVLRIAESDDEPADPDEVEEAKERSFDAILRTLRSAEWEQATKLLRIVAHSAFDQGRAAGRKNLGRREKWDESALLDLMVEIAELPKEMTKTARLE